MVLTEENKKKREEQKGAERWRGAEPGEIQVMTEVRKNRKDKSTDDKGSRAVPAAKWAHD